MEKSKLQLFYFQKCLLKKEKKHEKKNVRQMKVHGQSGYRYEVTPTIMLRGKWLKELGFEMSTSLIKCNKVPFKNVGFSS